MKTISEIRNEFPVLSTQMNGKPLVYLDNGATTQKPNHVIKTLYDFYSTQYGTIHRGVYALSQEATLKVDQAREKVRRFLGAKDSYEIIFTRGTTEAINLVARSFAGSLLKPGQSILVTEMEHHANWVPWQQICKEKNLQFKVAPMTNTGELDLEAFDALLTEDVGLVAMTHISNVLGTINPIKQLIEKAHRIGAKVLIDGAQAVSHLQVNVQDLDCDFYCFSSHKCYGPTGVGVLYGKQALLNKMPPYMFGGDMVETVTEKETTFAALPEKFEAGTPAIAEIIGLGAAIEYIQSIGFTTIQAHEKELLTRGRAALLEVPGLKFIGTAKEKSAIFSFIIEGIHPHDLGSILDEEGIAIRAGHHCAQPIMKHFGVPATARASFGLYNTVEEIAALVTALHKAREIML